MSGSLLLVGVWACPDCTQTECDVCVVRWTEAALSEPYWQSVQGERSSSQKVCLCVYVFQVRSEDPIINGCIARTTVSPSSNFLLSAVTDVVSAFPSAERPISDLVLDLMSVGKVGSGATSGLSWLPPSPLWARQNPRGRIENSFRNFRTSVISEVLRLNPPASSAFIHYAHSSATQVLAK
jgi:hypothetical protein